MTAKQYLQHYRTLEGNYKTAIEEYKNVENDMITLKSPTLGDKVQSSPQNDPIGDMVINLEKQKAKIGLKIVKYKKTQAYIPTACAFLFYFFITFTNLFLPN